MKKFDLKKLLKSEFTSVAVKTAAVSGGAGIATGVGLLALGVAAPVAVVAAPVVGVVFALSLVK